MRYLVTRQDDNGGPCRTLWTDDTDEADRIFDIAIQDGACFAEIYDWREQAQVRVEYPRLVWH